jgi:cobalamin biosynthetic protein CobC
MGEGPDRACVPVTHLPHGGSREEARRRFPGAPEPLLDLSTGINPAPYPLPPLPPECFTRLPEPGAVAALEDAAAAAYGVADPACVVAAPGTQILIELIPLLWPQPDITVVGPTYAEHAHAWRKAGSRVTDATDLAPAEAIALCNPNNPDGRRIPPARLLDIAAQARLLVVDEAFVDFEGEGLSLARAVPQPALIVLRSFGKTYGLAGLRLGFALTTPARAAALRAALGPWAVSGPAIAAGLAALPARGWREATAAHLATEAAALDATLAGAGMTVIGGTRLFRLACSNAAPEIFQRLGRAGIMVRRFAAEPRWLRFGIPPDDAARDRLARALGANPA